MNVKASALCHGRPLTGSKAAEGCGGGGLPGAFEVLHEELAAPVQRELSAFLVSEWCNGIAGLLYWMTSSDQQANAPSLRKMRDRRYSAYGFVSSDFHLDRFIWRP